MTVKLPVRVPAGFNFWELEREYDWFVENREHTIENIREIVGDKLAELFTDCYEQLKTKNYQHFLENIDWMLFGLPGTSTYNPQYDEPFEVQFHEFYTEAERIALEQEEDCEYFDCPELEGFTPVETFDDRLSRLTETECLEDVICDPYLWDAL